MFWFRSVEQSSRVRRWGISVGLTILALGLLCTAVGAQDCSSCDDDKPVKVGFTASVCSAHGYTITLNGTSVSGLGSCTANSWVTTGKAFTYLKTDVTYQITAGTDSCSTHIVFDVPEKYSLEINGIKTNTIDKAGGTTKGSGDGSWNVVIRKCRSCDDEASNSCNLNLGSVNWSVSMGRLSDGRSAESISILESVLSASIYTPAGLIYSPPGQTSEVDVVRNGDGSLRQIKAPQALADVVVLSGSEYEVRFYRLTDVGTKTGGVYPVSGQPFTVWKVKNPDPSTLSRLQISKIQNGATLETNDYSWDSLTNNWTLSRGGGLTNTTKAITYPTPTTRIETTIVKESNGQIVSKTSRTYRTFAWGEDLLKEVDDPDGASLTTLYTYYENPAELGRYAHLKSISYPEGLWEKYDYDANSNRVLVMRPWKDLSLSSATEANSYAIRYTYSNFDGVIVALYPHIISTVEEKIAGVLVRKTTYTRSSTPTNGEPAATEVRTEYSSSSDTLTTSTTAYHYSASTFYANRVAAIVHPDGTKDTFTYERGNYSTDADPSLNQFTPDANGVYQRTTVVHGTATSPDGVFSGHSLTTKEARVSDPSGHVVFNEVYSYNGTGYDRMTWTAMDYDNRGHLVQTAGNNNQVITATWNGDLKTSDTDESGIETDYTYDALNRIRTRIKKGVAASGGFPAQSDITTTYTYDAENRTIGEVTAGGTLSLSVSATYDRAGRPKSTTDASGLTTSYAYDNGGRTQTMTMPGGATSISDKFLDGQAKSLAGTFVVAKYYDYAVNPDGTRSTQLYTGAGGLASPRWTTTTVDWLGRTIKVETPTATAANLVRTFAYNSKGQMQSESATSAATKLMADKLYEYDAVGNQNRVGLDLNGDGALTPASIDRIVNISNFYQGSGSDWFVYQTVETYLTNNDATATTIQEGRQRLSHFPVNGTDKTSSERLVTYYGSVTTTTSLSLDRAARKATTTTANSGSNINAVNIAVNGLPQSSTPATPEGPTTYGYDTLGRPNTVTSPGAGTLTRTYDPATGQLIALSNSLRSVTYSYYPSTVSSAGRLKSQADSNGKKVYFNYDSRGAMIQSWGDTVNPQENIYDSYGQMIELHTFSKGSNWQSGTWPSLTTGSPQITHWTYHEGTGLLTQKRDALLKQTAYTYDALGRIKTRAWARLDAFNNPVTTTFSYDPNSGEMNGLTYSDSTPAIVMNYDRRGRRSSINDAAGTHALSFNLANDLASDQITGGMLNGVTVNVGYDSLLRRSTLAADSGGTNLVNQVYGYDATSRSSTIDLGGQTAAYTYHPSTGLLETTTYSNNLTVNKNHDSFGRLSSATTTPPAGGAVSYNYTYNNIDQRTRVTREDNSYWSYIYDSRGAVTVGKKYWSDNSPVAGQQFEFSFDNVGNRNYARAGGDSAGGGLRQSDYLPNDLNQYVQRTVPGVADISGTADSSATVTVNNQTTTRKGDYFNRTQTVDNSAAPVYAQTDVVGVKNGAGANGEDSVAQQSGRLYFPKALEIFSYDADGNLTSDGRWSYAWDAENRLISMEAVPSVPVEARKRLEFSYDYLGRRIQKKVYLWSVPASSYQLQSTTRFVYDQWHLIAELNGSNVLLRSYNWGASGLLSINEGGNSYQVGSDGNQNVTLLVNANSGAVAAAYDYDPVGNNVKATGDYAARNPFQFSSEYKDQESGLVYYGYRYYNPQTGKWISRDPAQESAGLNLYTFVDNDAINSTDLLGLWKPDGDWSGRRSQYSAAAVAECDNDTLSQLAKLATGDKSDEKYLSAAGRITKGTRVDVAPLLTQLEKRMRDKVIAATLAINTTFPTTPDQVAQAGVTVGTKNEADRINKFFKRKPFGYCECNGAAILIYAKALVDVLGKKTFNALHYNSTDVPIDLISGQLSEMLDGDWGYFQNYDDYTDKMTSLGIGLPPYQGENFIKLGKDAFNGLPMEGAKTESQWLQVLQDAYNKPQGAAAGKQRTDRIPGFDGYIKFIDVAKVATDAFRYRNASGGKCNK